MVSDNNRDLYRGVDDGWTRAIELVLTPVVAGGLGFGIDHIVGTRPLFTIVFGIAAVVASFVKMYYAYDAEMKAHDAASPWGSARRPPEAAETSNRSDAGDPGPARRHHGSAAKRRSPARLGGS